MLVLNWLGKKTAVCTAANLRRRAAKTGIVVVANGGQKYGRRLAFGRCGQFLDFFKTNYLKCKSRHIACGK